MATNSSRGAVLVTGASTGIGRACAEQLEELGFVVFAGVRSDRAEHALRDGRSERMRPLLLDVTDGASIAATADAIERAAPLGLAALVNNAGIGVGGPVELVSIDDWRRQFEVNLIGAIAVTQAMLPALRRGRGRVVNMTSIGGRLATAYLAPYNASKFALEAVTDSLRQEMRQFAVHVIAIEPGAVATPIWDKARESANEITQRFPADGLELYRSGIDALSKGIDDSERMGIPPEEVAKVVADAITSARPRPRYVVGRDAKMRLMLSRVLPTRTMDRLVARFMGI